MSEWLRRLTRNQLGFARAGSNPAVDENFYFKTNLLTSQVQCNVVEGASGEVALTAAGGLRQLPGLTEIYENAALVCVHYDGKLYEFVPWNRMVRWEMFTWGHWYITAENETHIVELEARTNEAGTPLRASISEAGLATACRDSCYGELKLQIWERLYDGSKGKVTLETKSSMVAVEIGGGPWFGTWKGDTSYSNELFRSPWISKLPMVWSVS